MVAIVIKTVPGGNDSLTGAAAGRKDILLFPGEASAGGAEGGGRAALAAAEIESRVM